MAVDFRLQAPPGASLKSLVKGFVLTQRTEGKSPATVEYYEGILRRFLWYWQKENLSDDARLTTEWQIREFLPYVAGTTYRWALTGNGSESSRRAPSRSTVHHYYKVLRTFFNWCIREGFLDENPLAKVKIANPKPKVVQPYTLQEIAKLLTVCDYDFQHYTEVLVNELLASVECKKRIAQFLSRQK